MNCVVKLYNNECWYFYYDANNGICFSKLDSKGRMADSCVLSSDAIDDFDVICDDNDAMHLCCQNTTGEIIYYRYINNDWNKSIILKSKFSSTNKKHFKLFSVNNWINVLYVLEYRGRNILVHHILEKTTKEPEIVDYIGESYTASMDSCGNIYAYYDSETKSSFGFKKYQWSKKEWIDFTQLHQYDNSNTFFNIFDGNDNPLIVTSKNKAVHFITENSDRVISTGDKPVIYRDKNTYIMQWIYKGKINGAISRDGCNTWEKVGNYSTARNITPDIFRVSVSGKSDDINCDYCYGYIHNEKVVLLGLENVVINNVNNSSADAISEEQIQSITDNVEPAIKDINGDFADIPSYKSNDYSIQLNKIIISLNFLNETNTKIEKRLNHLEKLLTDFEGKIKELPDGSSKKRWFTRG